MQRFCVFIMLFSSSYDKRVFVLVFFFGLLQSLNFRGQTLSDGLAIKDAGIPNLATVNVLARVLGGLFSIKIKLISVFDILNRVVNVMKCLLVFCFISSFNLTLTLSKNIFYGKFIVMYHYYCQYQPVFVVFKRH